MSMDSGHANLVIDPFRGFSVVFIDSFYNVTFRTDVYRQLDDALMEAAQHFGAPLTIELQQLKAGG
jgi:hypothetical protein